MAGKLDRREFLKTGSIMTAGTFMSGGIKCHLIAQETGEPARPLSANDHLQIALIGAGGQGQFDTRTAAHVPGVKVRGAADCYEGRLTHAKELWGADIQTTKDYAEILARKDIDAVIIATPDHWHKQAAVDAMNAGKDVYLEKPMIHLYPDGPEIIATAARTGRIIQVGSQRVSSIIYRKAKELLASGAIGTLNMITAWWDRNSSIGAWNYSIPLDASTRTCDWPRFLGTTPKIAWNPEHFFQWRKWKAYGSGEAGDLFVHLFSGTHFVASVHGPTRAMATGGLRYWRDGRDVPDVLLGLFDYPEGFNLSLRVNFVDGGSESEGLIFTGSEGTLTVAGHGVSLSRVPRQKAPGYTVESFAYAMQKEFVAAYRMKYPMASGAGKGLRAEEKYIAPPDYSDSYDHLKNFFDSVRSRRPVVEDAVFGYRAAGAALLSNLSYDRQSVVRWDPAQMRVLESQP